MSGNCFLAECPNAILYRYVKVLATALNPLTYLVEILLNIGQILENVEALFYYQSLSSVQLLLVFRSPVSVLQSSKHVRHIEFVFYENRFC